MNNKLILEIAVGIFFLFCSCGEKKSQKNQSISDIQVIKRSDFEKVERLKFNDPDYFEKTEFVKLEITDESILGGINQMEVFENCIYILDQKGNSVKKFDLTGKYIQDIGRVGLGSGEYIAVNAFYINPKLKTVNIFDPMKESVFRYDLDGKHLETIKLGLPNLAYVSGLSYLNEDEIFCFSYTNWMENCAFSVLNEKNYTGDCLYHYPIKFEGQMTFQMSIHPYTIRNGEVHYVLMFSDTIYSYKNNEVSKLFFVESGKPALEYHQITKIGTKYNNYTNEAVSSVGKAGKYTLGFMNFFESDSYICSELREYFAPGYLTFGAVLWNKTNNKGVYISQYYADAAPCFGPIFYCFDNTFVRVWREHEISFFKEHAKERDSYNRDDYPAEVWDVVDNYDEEDNPVLIFYTLKK